MNIDFKGVSNRDYMMVVAVIFELPNGDYVSVGCDGYSFFSDFTVDEEDAEEGWLVEYEMTWRACFIWDTKDPNNLVVDRYFVSGDEEILNNSIVVGFMTDHDAVDDYEMAFDEFEAY